MFCSKCGKEVSSTDKFCPSCGEKVVGVETNAGYQSMYQDNPGYQATNQTPYTPVSNNDEPNVGFMILSFFVPIVGIVLYCIWNKEYPLKAKSCLKGFIGSIVFYAIIVCCSISAIAKFANDYDDEYYWTYDSHIVEIVE